MFFFLFYLLHHPKWDQENGRGSKKKGGKGVEKVKPILVNKDEPVSVIAEPTPSQAAIAQESNHFDVIQPKDDLELIRSHSVSFMVAYACNLIWE